LLNELRILSFYITNASNVDYNQDRINLYQKLGLNEGKFDGLILHGPSGSFFDLETILAKAQGSISLGSGVSKSTGFRVKESFFKKFLLKSFEEISKTKNGIDNQKIVTLNNKNKGRRNISEKSWLKTGLEEKNNFYKYMLKNCLYRLKNSDKNLSYF